MLPTGANSSFSSFFKSITTKGVILSGKKFEMIFEYSPDILGVHESYWIFEIPSEKIIQYFLFVGNVMEPNVFIDVGKVNFGPLLLGGRNKEIVHLKNLEDVPIPFAFDRDSVKGDPEYADSLSVFPMNGVIKPDSDLPIEIKFFPKVERSFNYNLLCAIKRKSRPISLNVKGIGYILHHNLFYNQGPVALNPHEAHKIDFGDIFVNEKKTKIITIENEGDFNFDFTLKKNNFLNFISVNPEHGTIRKRERLNIEIIFTPMHEHRFKNKQNRLFLVIVSGPTYTFDVIGSARKPLVDLSFYHYDFGNCFVLKKPLSSTVMLEMRNRDNSAMSIETLYEKKPYLDFHLASGQVLLPIQYEQPKKELNVLQIPIVFTPRECLKYDENIELDINNLHKINLRIQGEGIPFKLEFDKTEDQNLDFGIVRVGADVTKLVTLINYSKKVMNLIFDQQQIQTLASVDMSVMPNSKFSIQPKEKKEIEVRFHPKNKVTSF